jgi:hypothetical protein
MIKISINNKSEFKLNDNQDIEVQWALTIDNLALFLSILNDQIEHKNVHELKNNHIYGDFLSGCLDI